MCHSVTVRTCVTTSGRTPVARVTAERGGPDPEGAPHTKAPRPETRTGRCVRSGCGLPAAPGVALLGGQIGDVEAHHGLAEPAGDLRDHLRVVVERGRLHDRRRALRRVTG